MCCGEVSAADCAVTLQGTLCQQLREKGLRLMVKGTFLQLELSEHSCAAERPALARRRAKSDSSVRLCDTARAYSHARAHSDPQYWEGQRDPLATEDVWVGERGARTEKGAGRPQKQGKGAQMQPASPGAATVGAGRKASGKGKRGSAKPPPSPADGAKTTLMLKNLPSGYLRPELAALLDERGFVGRFNFVHVPVDCFSGSGLGYGFINMVDSDAAERVHAELQGFSSWKAKSQKVLEVHWGEEQGVELLVERYRNSRMMHPSVPDAYRPVLLENGAVAAFPPPTKRILKPRCMPRAE